MYTRLQRYFLYIESEYCGKMLVFKQGIADLEGSYNKVLSSASIPLLNFFDDVSLPLHLVP